MIAGITHFTSQTAAAAILDGWRQDLVRGDEIRRTDGPAEVMVRLYSRSGTNDPLEQEMAKYDKDITPERRPKGSTKKFRRTFPDDVFMLCGSKPQDAGEATNRLEMWRAYGDDGRGVALTTWWNGEQLHAEGLEILEVKYVTDFKDVKSKISALLDSQADQNESRREREKRRRQRMTLAARYKLRDYESEEEVRLVRFLGDKSGAVRAAGRNEIHLDATTGRLRMYIERPVKLGTTLTKLDITLGPRMLPNDVDRWENVGRWMLAQMGLSGGTVQKSQLQYIG